MNERYALPQWLHAYDETVGSGVIRTTADDFVVDEILGYELSHQGEHVFLQIEKCEQNTEWLARAIARFAGIKSVDVGYGGKKDRHAVTRQWFSVRCPGTDEPDWQQLNQQGVKVLNHVRHSRKLRIGGIQGNRFSIKVKQFVGDFKQLQQRIEQIQTTGIPNYFGEQRFGFAGANVDKAVAMFAGAIKVKRAMRGLYLSAARSWLFNQIVNERIRQGTWQNIIPGDVMMLDGSHSVFQTAGESLDQLELRLQAGDIHLTGALPGEGQGLVSDSAAELEASIISQYPEIVDGLRKAKLKTERRAMRVIPKDLCCHLESDVLTLEFSLPVGSYATSVLREIVNYSDDKRD